MIQCNRRHLEQRCRSRGYELAAVMPCVVAQDGDIWTVDEMHPAYPRFEHPSRRKLPPPRATVSPVGDGPGTELKAILKDWLGIEASPTCSCNRMARKMNEQGPEWCESDDGMAEILGVMQAEHAKRWKAGVTKLPWADFGARQLVRLACRRARAKASA